MQQKHFMMVNQKLSVSAFLRLKPHGMLQISKNKLHALQNNIAKDLREVNFGRLVLFFLYPSLWPSGSSLYEMMEPHTNHSTAIPVPTQYTQCILWAYQGFRSEWGKKGITQDLIECLSAAVKSSKFWIQKMRQNYMQTIEANQ